MNITYKNWKFYKTNILLLIAFGSPQNAQAGWYTGGSLLIHPMPYSPLHSNVIKIGSSKTDVLGNGISINGGYKFCLNKYALASELDIGAFSDSDGNLYYQNVKHYVSASYYMAIKQKLGYHFSPNVIGYGLIGLSENSVGDRVYGTGEYFNRKQLSFLYGAGAEYYTKRDNKVAVFAEFIYFTPTHINLYSGGANSPNHYSLSTYGLIPQFGMRYYF